MVKNLPASAEDAGDTDSIPGSERSPGVGCVSLADSMDRGAWWATQQSMALQSVGDRQTDTHTYTHTHTHTREVAKRWEGGHTCMGVVGSLSD